MAQTRASVVSFTGSTSEVVRSIRQRDLLNKWLKLYAAEQRPPTFDQYHREIADADRAAIVFYTVIWENKTTPKVIIESANTIAGEAYASPGTNRELKEFLGPQRSPAVVPVYNECINRRLPVYTISEVTDDDGHKVDYERLLLPLIDDDHVTRLVGAFEMISLDGQFELKGLLSDHVPVDTLRVVIDKDLFFEPPPHIPASARLEFE